MMDPNPVLRQVKLPTGENGVIQPEKYVSYVKYSVPVLRFVISFLQKPRRIRKSTGFKLNLSLCNALLTHSIWIVRALVASIILDENLVLRLLFLVSHSQSLAGVWLCETILLLGTILGSNLAVCILRILSVWQFWPRGVTLRRRNSSITSATSSIGRNKNTQSIWSELDVWWWPL